MASFIIRVGIFAMPVSETRCARFSETRFARFLGRCAPCALHSIPLADFFSVSQAAVHAVWSGQFGVGAQVVVGA